MKKFAVIDDKIFRIYIKAFDRKNNSQVDMRTSDAQLWKRLSAWRGRLQK